MAIDRNPGGDATGLMQSLREQGGNSLLEAKNLGALIRKFISEVLDAVARASDGQISRDLGVATVEASCGYYARVMTGAAPSEYVLDPQWFPGALAKHLQEELDATGPDEAVIAEAWGSVANHVFEIAKLADEAEQRSAVDDLVRASLLLFSGMK